MYNVPTSQHVTTPIVYSAERVTWFVHQISMDKMRMQTPEFRVKMKKNNVSILTELLQLFHELLVY